MQPPRSVVGIDLAKRVLHVAGREKTGQIVLRQRVTREARMPCVAQRPPVVIGREACGRAHDGARRGRAHGHTVKLIAPQLVKPAVQSNQHDPAEAQALAEAVTRPTRRCVPITEVAPHERQALPRARERVVKARTALVHAIRGLGRAYGIGLPPGVPQCRHLFLATLEAEQATGTPLSRARCTPLSDAGCVLEKRLASSPEKSGAMGVAHPVGQRLGTMPGMGPVPATAFMAAVREASHCTNGRQFAAWAGLVPRQHATGGKPRRLGISKRGDVYLRTRLVHGARATLRWGGLKTDRRSQGRRGRIARRGKHQAAGALAKKHARMAWALLSSPQTYPAYARLVVTEGPSGDRGLPDDARRTTAGRSREVGPAASAPGLRHGFRSRGCKKEGKRREPQGPKNTGVLHQEAE